MRLLDEGLMCYVTGVKALNDYCARAIAPRLYASIVEQLWTSRRD